MISRLGVTVVGNVLFRVSSGMAENVTLKVAWRPAECWGVHSYSAGEERVLGLFFAKGEILGAGQDTLSTFPSCQGHQVCP